MHLLHTHLGSWTGTNQFRMMPTDEPSVAPATAQLHDGAGGTITVVRYTWTHPESGVQEGLLAVGTGESPDAAVALWGDSWHQAPAAASLTGTVGQSEVTLAYAYGEGWEWRIVLDVGDPEVLRLRMDNVVPQAVAAGDAPLVYWAMQAQLRR